MNFFKRNSGNISVKNELESFLKQNNVEATVEVDKVDKCTNYTFMYQGGNFIASVDKSDRYMTVYYPSFKDVSVEYIDEVRAAINRYNHNVPVLKFSYSTHSDGKTVFMHMEFIDERVDCDMLSQKLAACFHYNRVFSSYLDDSIKDTGLQNGDWETRASGLQHKQYLISECEINAQHPNAMLYRENDTEHFTLKLLLYTIDLHDIIYKSLTVSTAQGTRVITDHNEIALTDLPRLIVSDDAESWTGECATAMLSYTLPSDDTVRYITMGVTQAGNDDVSHYVRITLALVPSPAGPTHQRNTMPRAMSVLAAVDKRSPKAKIDEFQYMWKDAKIKRRDGEQLSCEQRYLATVESADLGYNYYWGMRHFDNERYLDAVSHFENLYFTLKEYMLTPESTGLRDMFFDVCYHLGFAYLEIWNPIRAYYFLDIAAFKSGDPMVMSEYINVLANMGDVRGIEVAERMEEFVAGIIAKGGDSVEYWCEFMEFLKRRKGFMLINFKLTDAAEELFNTLLDSTYSRDYAIKMLDFIKEQREQADATQDESPQ